MSKIVLGDNQYGKAETHVVRVTKSGSTHEITDLNVSIALAGDFSASHHTGDNSKVVPTDTQKNTVFAFAKESPKTSRCGSRAISRATSKWSAVPESTLRSIRGRESPSRASRTRMRSFAPVWSGGLRPQPAPRTPNGSWAVSPTWWC